MPEKALLISPGDVLKEDFLDPLGITAYRLALETHIPQSRVSGILSGSRRITANTAMRFARFFGTSPEFWMNLQTRYDLDKLQFSEEQDAIENIHPLVTAM